MRTLKSWRPIPMSLLDALLLEAFPLDVWIAVRTDGVRGTGTENDPWNGSIANTHTFPVSITNNGTNNTAVATSTNHPFKNGDLVLISGATGADAKYYNGTFSISNVSTNAFEYTMWGIP